MDTAVVMSVFADFDFTDFTDPTTLGVFSLGEHVIICLWDSVVRARR